MKKQRTAIEYLIDECPRINTIASLELIEVAKELEKQLIIDAFNEGEINSVDYFNPENITTEEAEQYYNETFNK
jgi:hypothetical protein